MIINERLLNTYCTDIEKKKTLAVNEPDLIKEFLTYIQLHSECMKNMSAYEMANNIKCFYMWYKDKDRIPLERKVYHREVYYINLGAYNLKYEESFIHPCVVIKQCKDKILVIPGSTKQYKKGFKYVIDVNAGNGFLENTGVMINQIRMVSTSRIVGRRLGKMNAETYNVILDSIMSNLFSGKNHEMNVLKNELEKSNKMLEKAEERIKILEEELKKHKEALLTK